MKKMNRDNWEEKKKELTEQFLRRFHKTDLIIPLIVMAVLVIVVVIVTLFFRQTEIRHVKESVYTYIFDTPSVMEDGLTLKDTKDGYISDRINTIIRRTDISIITATAMPVS